MKHPRRTFLRSLLAGLAVFLPLPAFLGGKWANAKVKAKAERPSTKPVELPSAPGLTACWAEIVSNEGGGEYLFKLVMPTADGEWAHSGPPFWGMAREINGDAGFPVGRVVRLRHEPKAGWLFASPSVCS
jgi:hypothetical protein